MKLTDILIENEDLAKLADEISAAGPQVLDFFLKALAKNAV
jgi:hypothetical protein